MKLVDDVIYKLRKGDIKPDQALKILHDARSSESKISRSTSWEKALEEDLSQLTCDLLKIDGGKLEMDIPVSDLGLDSLSATEFNNLIRGKYGITLQATAFFECNTLRDFYNYICKTNSNKIIDYYKNHEKDDPQKQSNYSFVNLSESPMQDKGPKVKFENKDPIRARLDKMWNMAEKDVVEDSLDDDFFFEDIVASRLLLQRRGLPSLSVVTAGEGTPLLLLGGLMNPERIWSKQVRSLVANHRLIIFNKPGVGKSELRQKDLSIEGIVGDIKYVLNTLNVNSSIDIVGFSFGGMLAQQFAFEYPDMVNSMILINTAAKATKRLNNVDLLRDEVNSCPEVISINGEIDFSVAAMYGELSNNFDSREKIIQCAMPILVLSGSCDRYVDSAQSKELVSLLPNAEHKVIEARHFSLLTHPNELNQYMMNFLKDNRNKKND